MKQGLDYFSFDVDFFQDEKIQFVSARFGMKGEIIVIRLLCRIYRQGYYINWNNDAALLFAKSVGDGCQHSFVNDVVYELLKRDFFDKAIFERFAVLTSNGIQKRYLGLCEYFDIQDEVLLIEKNNIPKYKTMLHKQRLYNINVIKWYKIINSVFKRDSYTCQYCGKVGGILEADHIVPFSKGGNDNLANLKTACRKCNRQKKDKSVEEFIKWRENHA
jgi:hypothetical protein